MTYKSFYVPLFPIEKITNHGMDGWVHDKTHKRHKYGFLETILEHIDNSGFIEPVMISYHNANDVSAGPSGVARLWALRTMRNATLIPAIVVTKESLDWLPNKVEITSAEQLRTYFQLEPKDWGISEDGRAYWHNQNPNKEQATATLKVSPESLALFLKCIED